jgi:outer membrane protein assembly complex protein YaeT
VKQLCFVLLVLCLAPGAFRPVLSAQEEPRIVMGVKFSGAKSIPTTTLAAAISTTNSGWFARTPPFKWLGFLGEKRIFDERQFVADVLRLQFVYKYSGFLEVRIDTVVQRKPDQVKVEFKIKEGPPVIVTSLQFDGIQPVPQKSQLLNKLPLEQGKPFNRFFMVASADTIMRRLRNRGYPAAQVLKNFQMDSTARTAEVTLQVLPGPSSRIGTIRVEGTSPIDTGFVRRMVPARAGRLFSQDELYTSQRNLYRTELFQFASVNIDSANYETTDSVVPLLVRVREGKLHRVRSSLGYGTTDCFRGGASWRARNFSGGGRIFEISGRASKVGVGTPLNAGLDGSLCTQLRKDPIGSDKLNYNLTVSLEQPGFIAPLNTLTYSAFADRRSEFQVYLREELGGSVTIRREGLRRVPLTLGYKISYGHTEASKSNFCAFFSACTGEDIDLLSQSRFLGTLTGTITLPRANNALDPTKGYVLSGEATVSSRFLGSSSLTEFVKLVGDGAWYAELDRDMVLSWHLRAGAIFAPQIDAFTSGTPVAFIPPDERFYAGGPNDVRGYSRNELGPVVYVVDSDLDSASTLHAAQTDSLHPRFSATGGNMLLVGNMELRLPSPIFAGRMRLAVFVDAGTLFERGKADLAPSTLRITPGFGFRFATPLGPARLDIAYNGYERQPGALYQSFSNGDLVKIADNFVSGRRSNFTFQFAIGQPF